MNPEEHNEPVQSVEPLPPQKKSRTKLIVLSVVIVAIIAAAVCVLLLSMKKPATPDTSSSTQPTTTNASVDAITKSLTDGPASETTLTNTDDSSAGTNASASAGTVGDSVDENNF